MSVIFIVLPIALVVVLAAVAAFLWSARRGQFDDLTTPAIRAIQDDAVAAREGTASSPPRATSRRTGRPPRRGSGPRSPR